MANATTNKSLTYVGIAPANGVTQEMRREPRNLTKALRRALIEHPGAAGALGSTGATSEDGERQAAQFCQARPADCVASVKGDFRARVYELPGGRWGVVVWFDDHDHLNSRVL